MLAQVPRLRDAACMWITKYDGYTPAKRFIIPISHGLPNVGFGHVGYKGRQNVSIAIMSSEDPTGKPEVWFG